MTRRDIVAALGGLAILGAIWAAIANRPSQGQYQHQRCACQHCTCRCHIRHDELLPEGYDSWDEVNQDLESSRP